MKIGRRAFKVVSVIAILNFIAFGIASFHYSAGGVPATPLFTALPKTGPYLLDDHGHGTEVSRQIYIALLWQSRILIVTFPLLAIWRWHLSRRGRI